jgi:NAD+ synthase
MKGMGRLIEEIVSWIRMKVEEAGATGTVVGLSGGVDSAVVGALCKMAFPETTLGLIMPCHSLKEDVEDAMLVARKFGIEVKLVDLSKAFESIYEALEGKGVQEGILDIPTANIKPRLRMITLYYYASKLRRLVVGTGNRSEISVGYFTKYGDGGVDILPIGGLLKSEVRALAAELGVPRKIMEKPPSAGLWAGQTDEGEMGITYEMLDGIIKAMDSGDISSFDPELVEKVKLMIERSEHKRNPPPIFRPSFSMKSKDPRGE